LLRALQSDADQRRRASTKSLVSTRDETDERNYHSRRQHRKSVRGWDFKIIVGRVLDGMS